jgi:hypothetical protein
VNEEAMARVGSQRHRKKRKKEKKRRKKKRVYGVFFSLLKQTAFSVL